MHLSWEKHDSLTSTSLLLAERLRQERAVEGLVIYSEYQANGKGQGSHIWQSEARENLLMSLLLKPAFLSASSQFLISQLCSLALCELLEYQGLQAGIKWPNDILVGDRKIAGILIEHVVSGPNLSHSILGIGLNLRQLNFPRFERPATSIALEIGKRDIEPFDVAEQLGGRLLDWYEILRLGEHERIREAYLDRLYLLGEEAGFSVDGKEVRGKIEGISAFGELMVRISGKTRKFQHGEIGFLQ